MKKSRREFMKDAACVSAAAAAVGTTVQAGSETAHADEQTDQQAKCPFFDQPLVCGGPGANGAYPCDE